MNSQQVYGNALSLAAGLIWAFSTRLYRQYGQTLHPVQLTVFKGFIAGVVLSILTFLTGGFTEFSPDLIAIIGLSGIIGIGIGDSAYFAAFSKIGATLTASIQCCVPLLTCLSAWTFLEESLSIKQWSGMAITSVSLVMIIKNQSQQKHLNITNSGGSFTAGLVFALLAAVCQTTAATFSRNALKELSAFEGSFYRILSSTLLLTLIIPMTRSHSNVGGINATISSIKGIPNKRWLVLASILGTVIGLWCMIEGIRYTQLGIALTLNSTYPLWIVILDAMTHSQLPDRVQVTGLISAITGIYLTV